MSEESGRQMWEMIQAAHDRGIVTETKLAEHMRRAKDNEDRNMEEMKRLEERIMKRLDDAIVEMKKATEIKSDILNKLSLMEGPKKPTWKDDLTRPMTIAIIALSSAISFLVKGVTIS